MKLERVFAKPFIGNLDGHRDGIFCMAKHPKSLSTIASGSYDGEVRLWNLTKKKCINSINGHDRFVRGLCFNFDGTRLFSVGDDSTVKVWNTEEFETPSHTFISQVCKNVEYIQFVTIFLTMFILVCFIWCQLSMVK